MEILRFIFSSFWIWLGFTISIVGILDAIASIIMATRGVKDRDEDDGKDIND